MTGYRSRHLTKNGKRQLVFDPQKGYTDLKVTVPCRQCVGCRLEKSREWALRCVHEASLHEDNCFLTLTYNDVRLPETGSLIKKHFQDFIKRLRSRTGKKFSYYHCGEYGDKLGRPHYHAIIFGLDFQDKKYLKHTNQGDVLYTSKLLDDIWQLGYAFIGSVTFESAAYVARYIMKKVTGDQAENHYVKINENTGEYNKLLPEYTTSSTNPAIAKNWYKEFKTDVYPSDFITKDGKKYKPPKYYDRQYEIESPEEFEKLKRRRRQEQVNHVKDQTPERLAVREKVKKAQLTKLKRHKEI